MKKNVMLVLASVCLLGISTGGAGNSGVSGTWLLNVETEAGAGSPTFTFKQQGEALSGQYSGAFGEAPVTGRIRERDIEFSISVQFQDRELNITYTGTVEGEEMKGTVRGTTGGQEFSGTWTGKRQAKGK